MSDIETTGERQTEIERKLQEQAERLSQNTIPDSANQTTPELPQAQNWQNVTSAPWPQSGQPDWNAQQQPPPFTPPPGGFKPYIPEQAVPVRKPGLLERWRAKGGFLGTLAAILMFLVKAGGPLLLLLGKLKFLFIGLKVALALGTMLVSMWAYSTMFGWPIGVGLVLLIFIHECGHALAAKSRGIPTGIMVFVPFMGAFVTTKRGGHNLEEDAFIGIMGPVVGSLASLGCFLMYFPTGNPFWLALGQLGFFINLFNLLPTPPLDGGWIAPLFSPKLLAIGAVIAVVVGFRNPLIWLLLVVSIPRIISGWKADPKTQPFYRVSRATKWKYGIAYIGLAVVLAVLDTLAQTLLQQAQHTVLLQ